MQIKYYIDNSTYVLSDLITGKEWAGGQHISNDFPNSILIMVNYADKNTMSIIVHVYCVLSLLEV